MFFRDFFSSDELQFVKYVFSIRVSSENKNIPTKILKLIPKENVQILNSMFSKPNDIIRELSLVPETRIPLIEEISHVLNREINSDEYDFYSLIIIQSSTFLLFKPLKEINSDVFLKIFSCLNISLKNKRISKEKKEEFLSLILNRLVDCDVPDYLPAITNVFMNHPDLVNSCVQKCFDITKTFLKAHKKNISMDDQMKFSLFITRYNHSVSSIIGKKEMNQTIKLIVKVLSNNIVIVKEFGIALFDLLINLMQNSPCISIIFDVIDDFAQKPTIFQFAEVDQTNDFTDIPTTPIMGFHNVPEDEEKPTKIKFKVFTEINYLRDHPIVPIVSTVTQNKIFGMKDVYQKMIEESLTRLSQGFLHYVIILFIFVSNGCLQTLNIPDFLNKEDLWDDLINPILFNSEENFIKTPDSDKVILRYTMFKTVEMIINSADACLSKARKALLNILRQHIQDSQLFGEILLMTFPILRDIYEYHDNDDDLFEILYSAAIIQQHRHVFGDNSSGKLRVNTFKVVSALLLSRKAALMIQRSNYACTALCSTLFESDYYDICSQSLKSLLSHLSSEETFSNIINALHLLFLGLLPSVTKENGYELLLNIVKLMDKMIRENSIVVSCVVLNSPVLSDILACVIKITPTKETKSLFDLILSLLFGLQYSSDFNPKVVPYQALGTQLNAIGIDDTTYRLIINNISGTKDSFNRISQPYALQLLLYAVKGTKRYKEILEMLLSLCENSICNRCSCLVGGLINFIFDYYDDTTYDITLKIFEVISASICSKSSLFSFIRHFSKLEAESMNKRLLSSLSCLTRIMQKAKKPAHFGLIQLTSPLSFIQIPNYRVSELVNGMLIDFEVLLDSLTGETTLIEFGTGSVRLAISIKDGRIHVSSIDSYGEQSENSSLINFPIGQFFKFTVVLVFNNFISFFINNKFIKGMPIVDLAVRASKILDCNLILKSMGSNSIQMQIKEFTIKIYESQPTDWSEIPKNINANMSVYFSGTSISKGKLLMKTDKEDRLVDMRGIFIPFYSNFMKIFEASHTIEYITSLFGSSDMPDALQVNLFNTLIEIYTIIISKSTTIIQQINDANGFVIIAYFLDDLPSECITTELWRVFVAIYALVDPVQRDQLCRSIIFNLDIWKKGSIETQIAVTRDIYAFSDERSTILLRYLGIQSAIKYLMFIIGIGNDTLIQNTIKVLVLAVENEFDQSEQNALFLFIYSCLNFDVSLQLLRLLSKLKFNLATNIEWCSMFLHPSEALRVEWAKIFFSEEREKRHEIICFFTLISNTSNKLTEEDDPNKSFIVYCINKALDNKEMLSLEEIGKLPRKVVKMVPFLFALAQIGSAGPEITNKFNTFIVMFVKLQENIDLLSTKFGKFSLSVLIFYLIKSGRQCIKSLGDLFLSGNILKDSIGIIDAFQSTYNCDLEDVRLEILESAFEALIESKMEPPPDIYTVFINAILFHTKVTTSNMLIDAFSNQTMFEFTEEKKKENSPPSFLFSAVLHFVSPEEEIPKYYFSLSYRNGKWVEETLAKKVLFAAMSKCTEVNSPILDSIYILLYAFIVISADKVSVDSIAPIISEVYERTDKEDPRFIIIIYLLNAFKHAEIACVSLLINKHREEIGSYMVKLETTKQILEFSNTGYPNWISEAYLSLRRTFKVLIERHSHFYVPLSNEVTEVLDKVLSNDPLKFNRTQAEHSWKRLWQSMTLTHNPFLTSIEKPHFKRGNIIGSDFCPILLKRNAEFTIHAEASKNCVDESLFLEKLPSHFNFFYEARELKPIKFNEKLSKWREPCDMIKVQVTTKGVFNVFNDSFTFVSDDDYKSTKILFTDVKYIFLMNILQRPTAVEIFTHSHKSYFFNFPSITDKQQLKSITNNNFPNAEFIQTKSGAQEVESLQLTHKWQTRQISTFTYLMWLNQLSGRSFNNVQNYPIFPWIISDYSSNHINLNNPNVFRDLSKPVGALNEERLAKLKTNMLLNDREVPILYRSTYSCPFHVYYFLLRLEPYTTLHIEIQDGHFDVPSRLFYSIAGAWNSAAGLSNNFKELIPEFFFLPDFLKNTDHFKLGVVPEGFEIDDVVLPPWASTPEEFVQINREALECDYVGQHINQWIDLIWGVNQTGENAIKADNIYDRRLYENVWDVFTDPDERPEIEAMLKHVGIIPAKLFDSPHPPRNIIPVDKKYENSQQYQFTNECVNITVSNDNFYVLSSNASVYTMYKNNQEMCVANNSCDMAINCAIADGLFAYLTFDSHIMSIIGQNGKITTMENTQHIEGITCIASCGKFIFTGGKDGVFAEWTTKKSVMSHSESIVCCNAREEQNIAVSCDVDGLMIIMTANPLKFVRAIDMELPEDTVPQCVSIGSNGVIAVVSGHQVGSVRGEFISLFTINGTKYAEERIGATAIEVIVLRDGTILIAVATHNHALMLFSGVSFKLKDLLIRSDSQITSLHFDNKSQLLYACSKDGKLFVFSMNNR